MPTGTATFGSSLVPAVAFTAGTASTVNTISFTGAAVPYTFSIVGTLGLNTSLILAGTGIQDASTGPQNFITSGVVGGTGSLIFQGSSTAGDVNITNNANGITQFTGSGTAGTSTITANTGGSILFAGSSTGGSAQLVVERREAPSTSRA